MPRPSGGFSADPRETSYDSDTGCTTGLLPLYLRLCWSLWPSFYWTFLRDFSKLFPDRKENQAPKMFDTWTMWFHSPAHGCSCPSCPPSPSRVIVRKDWLYPVLTLYLGAVVLHSLFLRNMQHGAGSLGCVFSSCLWPWGDSLWLQMCYPVERLSPKVPLWPSQTMLNSSQNWSRVETWLGRSKGSILKF